MNGGIERVDQAAVIQDAGYIDDQGAGIGEVVESLLEEFLCGEMPGDIGRLVGIDADDVVTRVGMLRPQRASSIYTFKVGTSM